MYYLYLYRCFYAHIYVGAAGALKKASDPLKLELQVMVRTGHGCWDQTEALKNTWISLTAASSFQPPHCHFCGLLL